MKTKILSVLLAISLVVVGVLAALLVHSSRHTSVQHSAYIDPNSYVTPPTPVALASQAFPVTPQELVELCPNNALPSSAQRKLTIELLPKGLPTAMYSEASFSMVTTDVDGSHPIDVGIGHQPQLSPDGKMVAYADDHDIIVVNSDGTNKHTLTSAPEPSRDWYPIWSPKGTYIAFTRVYNWKYGDRDSGISEILVARADGSELKHLTKISAKDNGNVPHSLVWTPDEKKISYEIFGEDSGIFAVSLEDSYMQQLVTTDRHRAFPVVKRWTEKGDKLSVVMSLFDGKESKQYLYAYDLHQHYVDISDACQGILH